MSSVGQNDYGQLTGTSLAQLKSDGILYVNQLNQYAYLAANNLPPKKFAKSSDYLAYKRAQLLSASRPNQRPPASVIITELQSLNS